MTNTPLTTPDELERWALDRRWTYERLAAEIATVTGCSISTRTVSRFCKGEGPLRRLTRDAVERYMAAQRAALAPRRKRVS